MSETSNNPFADPYSLPRSDEEGTRLELQHRLAVANLGFLLHPRIEKALPESARIADVATGTGIWMEEVASTSPPGWSFHGYDMSDAMYPPPAQQSRCSYEVLDILEPIPEHLLHSFDLVHIRYIIPGLTKGQWSKVAQQVLLMLKPGGYLQWHESNFCCIKSMKSKAGDSIASLQKLYQTMVDLSRPIGKLLPDIIDPGLRLTIESSDFADIQEEVIASDRVAENRMDVSLTAIKAVYFIVRHMLQDKGRDDPQPQNLDWVDELYKGAVGEIRNGSYMWWDMHVFTATRPVTA